MRRKKGERERGREREGEEGVFMKYLKTMTTLLSLSVAISL